MQKNVNLGIKMLQWHRFFSVEQQISEYIIAIIYRYLKTNLLLLWKYIEFHSQAQHSCVCETNILLFSDNQRLRIFTHPPSWILA